MAWSGVDLFFVLSGFLIGGILLENRRSDRYFKTFYIRRACRILPPYAVVLLLFYGGIALDLVDKSTAFKWLFENPMPFWSYATFTQNFVMAHRGSFGAAGLDTTWSLAVEEQFYLLFPLVIRYAPKKRLPWFLLAGALLAPASRIAFSFVYPATPGAGGYLLMPCRADALIGGALLACGFRSKRFVAALRRNINAVKALFLFLFASVMVMTFVMPEFDSRQMTFWGRSWLALFFATLLVVALIDSNGFIATQLRNRFLRQLGIISYGVYLLHHIIYGLVQGSIFERFRPSLGTDLLLAATALVISVIVASTLYYFVERPILRIGKAHKF